MNKDRYIRINADTFCAAKKHLTDAQYCNLITSVVCDAIVMATGDDSLPVVEADASLAIIHDWMLDTQDIVRLDGDQYE